MRELRGLLAAVAGCEAVGLVGAPVTARSAREWLPTLNLPPFQPPGWVFGPVWTVLYAVKGVSLDAVRRSPRSPERDRAMRLFAVQLACNALWSFLFFGRRSTTAGLVDVLVLLVALLLTVQAVARVDRRAAVLLLPYLAWTTFAAALTAEIWRRNR